MVDKAKMGLKGIVCAGIIGLALAGGAREARATIVPFDSNSIVKDNIAYYIQTDKSIYDLGENVEMLFRVTNLSNEEFRVIALWPIWDITVEAKEGADFEIIWWNTWDKSGPAGPVIFQLDPYESKDQIGIWPQIKVPQVIQVPPGTYRISGVFNPDIHNEYKVSVNVDIIPEPGSLVLLGVGLLFLIRKGKVKHS